MSGIKARCMHGCTHHPSFGSWRAMMKRCYVPTTVKYEYYGGRGIKVCDRWHDVRKFIHDMGVKPPGKSLDRIDNNGHYEPSNCRWASMLQQHHNTSRNVFLEHGGKRMILKDWSIELGINEKTLSFRHRKGMSVEMILYPGKISTHWQTHGI